MKRENIFRSALFILSDDGQTRENIIGKIIELTIYEKEDKLSLRDISSLIKDSFDLDFNVEQLFQGLIKRKDRFDFNVAEESFDDIDALRLQLKDSVRNKLKEKIEKNTINVVREFIKYSKGKDDFEFKINTEYVNKLISKFTYFLFQSSQNEVMTFFKEPSNGEFKNGHHFNDKERKVLELFLGWDNSSKRNLLKSVILFSFEYCMIVTNTSENALKDIFTNTMFYLDSNILVRAIGINGEEWATRSNIFLNEIKKMNSNYFISTLTYEEIKVVIDFKIDELAQMTRNGKDAHKIKYIRDSIGRIERKAFEFWEVFYKWSIKNKSKSLSRFKRFLIKDLDRKLEKHKISIIKVKYVNEQNDYVQSLYDFKNEARGVEQNLGSVRKDISNLLKVVEERPKTNILKNRIKNFFLTEDLLLYKWSRENLHDVLPVVITSNSVYTFYNKYKSSYLTDDFTSYMNFIDMRQSDSDFLINEEDAIAIVKKINIISSNPKEILELSNYVKDVFNESIESGKEVVDLSVLLDDKLESQYLKMKEKEMQNKFASLEVELLRDTKKAKEDSIVAIVKKYKLRDIYIENRSEIKCKLIFWFLIAVIFVGLLGFMIFDFFSNKLISLNQITALDSFTILMLDIIIRIIWAILFVLPFKKIKNYIQDYNKEKSKIKSVSDQISKLEVDVEE